MNMRDQIVEDINQMILATYMTTRLGNCVTCPFSLQVFASRLAHRSILRKHRFTFLSVPDPATGKTWNVETTNGATSALMTWMQEQIGISDLAISSGIDMRTITNRESAGILAHVLTESEMERVDYRKAIDCAGCSTSFHPTQVYASLKQGSACGYLLEELLDSLRATGVDPIPTT